jgi:hypothetical protein
MVSPRPEYSPCIKKDEFIRCQNILYIDRGFYKYIFTCAVRVLEYKKISGGRGIPWDSIR